MFLENAGTNRGAMLFRMIGRKRSFCFMIASRESTQRLSWTLPCRIPIPYGPSRKMSFVIFAFGIGRRDQRQGRVVEHDRVRPPLVEGDHGVRDAVGDHDLGVVKQRFIQRS